MHLTLTQRHYSSPKFSHVIRRSLFLIIYLSMMTLTLVAQSEKEMPALEPGKPIERELAGDAAHSYIITLAANQFLHVVVEQKGIDVVVSLFAPDGKKVAEVDSPNGAAGPEPVSIVAETPGSYRLEVRSLEAKAEAGRYQVEIKELRAAKPHDKSRIAAQQLLEEATQLESERTVNSYRKAISRYEEAVLLLREINDRPREGQTLSFIGGIYQRLGEKQKALDFYNQALPLSRAAGDRGGEGATLSNMGMVYNSLGERQKALEYFSQSLRLRRAVGDRSGEAVTLSSIGIVYYSLGEKQKALDYFNQALPILHAAGERTFEADTLTYIGVVYNSLGEKQKALDYYKQALTLSRSARDRGSEAATLSNIGVVYDSIGEKQTALDYFNQALPLRREVGDRGGEAATFNNIAAAYNSLGEKQKALDYYDKALPLLRAVGDRNGEAYTLSNIGAVYDSLGERQKALAFYNQALPIRRAVGDRSGEAVTLNNIGSAYYSLGETQKSLDSLNQALPILRAVGDRGGEATTLNNIGVNYDALGERQKALGFFNQALSLRRAVGDRRGEADTLTSTGRVYDALGENQKALDFYNQALPLRRAVGDRGGEAETLALIAKVERDRSNLSEARVRIEEALTIVESLRTKIASTELRSSYFATVTRYYDFYIDLLMQLHKQQPSAGHDGAALQASERGRARSLLESLSEASADIRQGVDPSLVERERSLQLQLNSKAQTQMKLLNGKHTDAQAEVIAKEIETSTTEYQQIEAEIRQKSPNYAALTQPEPLSLKEIQTQVLDKDTLLLEYSLGDERSYVWAVTPNSITSYELLKRDEIEALARQVYALVTNAKQWKTGVTTEQKQLITEKTTAASAKETLAKLSQMLLAPVAEHLGKKRLLIIADGALQYIPFGALQTPQRGTARKRAAAYHPLIIEHEIVSLPSASTLAVLRKQVVDRKPAPKTVAVLADPVFETSDERVSHTVQGTNGAVIDKPTAYEKRELPVGLERSAGESGLMDAELKIPRLPGTRTEATQILALVAPAQRKEAFDFAANRQAATSDDLSQYRYVHFATHGFLNSVHPELSGLVFSMVDETGKPQDGFLRAHEIFNLKLPAELVVLSACQTGLGKEVKGEGIVGLTRGFMYAGSPRVVVSLWNVSDQATAELMMRFYRGMLKNKMRPAAALRAAQVSLMKEKKWQSPFYWAAFTLQGEWR